MKTMQRRGIRAVHCAGAAWGLERLEDRRLLTTPYGFESFVELFGLDLSREIAPPDAFDPSLGAGVAGFGYAVAGLGDIDGDGRDDFAIAAPGSVGAGGGTDVSGKVFFYSGADGSVIRTIGDGFAGFGFALANVGDLNGDGVADLLVGSPRFDADADAAVDMHGRGYVYSGADGALIHTFTGAGDDDELGFAVAMIGDQNGDSVADLAIGAPGAGGAGEGQAIIFSGADGSVIRTYTGAAPGDRFGHVVASTGDLPTDLDDPMTADGVDELLVTAPGTMFDPGDGQLAWDRAGQIFVYDGATGALRWSKSGSFDADSGIGDGFGSAAAVVGRGADAIVVVGEPGKDGEDGLPNVNLEPDVGQVFAFDAAGEQVDRRDGLSPGGAFGTRIFVAGDIDRDSRDEVVILGADDESLEFRIFNLVPEFNLFAIPDVDALSGTVLAAIGDVNGDGLVDVLSVQPGAATATLISSIRVRDLGPVISANPSLTFINGVDFALINGVYTAAADIPGVGPDGLIVGVNDAGLIVGALSRHPSGAFHDLFIVDGGVRTMLTDAVTSVVGGVVPDLDEFSLAGIGDDGSVLFNEESAGRAWVFKDGVLTFLWNGVAYDINAGGIIVGASQGVGIMRAADGTVDELFALWSASAINDEGLIGGTAVIEGESKPVLFRDGQVVVLEPNRLPLGVAGGGWRFEELLDDGRGLLTLEYNTSHTQGQRRSYVLDSDGSLTLLEDLVFGDGDEIQIGQDLSDDGLILLHDGVLSPLSSPDPWAGQEGAPVDPGTGADDPTVAVPGELELLVFINEAGQWRGVRLDGPSPSEVDQVLTYVDRADGELYAFVITGGDLYWGRVASTGTSSVLLFKDRTNLDVVPSLTNAATFISTDGRVHLAGVTPEGDLVILYQTGQLGSAGPLWAIDDLTVDHLEAQGATFTPVAGELTVYVAPWGANHIAYLDSTGEVQVVWWAPGMTYWTTTNLSDVAGATPLHGRITSYVTPWAGLNVAGTDADGNLVALWWVPSFGGEWRFDRLGGDSTPKLDAATITSYVTPWGGLNIAGANQDTGDVTVYWWTPATNQWRADQMMIMNEPADFVITGALSSSVTGEGTQSIFARQSDGRIIRLFWDVGDGAIWTYESISDAAAAAF